MVKKTEIVVSERFEKSFQNIIENLSTKQSIKLGRLIDNLIKMLSIFPESYQLLVSRKHCDLPLRKAVLTKRFIVIYIYQKEKIYLIDLFYATQNWENKLIH